LKLRLFDAATGKPIGSPLKPGGKRADHVALSSDGKLILTGSHLEKTAQLWNFATGQPVGSPLPHPDWVTAVAFSPDGKMMATGCKDKTGRLWDTGTGQLLGQVMQHALPVVTLAFSPDGKTLASGCSDDVFTSGEVRLWDVPSGQSLSPPLIPPNSVLSLAFRPDDRFLAVGDGKLSFVGPGQGNVSIWKLPSPAAESVDRLRLMIQVMSGLELRDTIGFQPLSAESWRQRKRHLESGDVETPKTPAP
jgi:WD40 repeat protein